jgi:hypothetical protein
MFTKFVLTFSLLLALSAFAQPDVGKTIFDPFFIFCGSRNCYDILGVDRSDNITTISKAYRQLSRTVHPDKVHPDKRVNVTEEFRLITKAHEVLKGNESRKNFDFYLDHPRQYYKATGKHAFRALPKLPFLVSVLLILVFATAVNHIYSEVKRKQDTESWVERIKNVGKKNAEPEVSTKAAKKAAAYFEKAVQEFKRQFASLQQAIPEGDAMVNSPSFATCCNMVLDNDPESPIRKPTYPKDLVIVKFFTVWPSSILTWAQTYYRRHLSGIPLSDDDKIAMARDMISQLVWDELSEEDRKDVVARGVWESDAYDQWIQDRLYTVKTEVLTKTQAKKQSRQAEMEQKQLNDKHGSRKPKIA